MNSSRLDGKDNFAKPAVNRSRNVFSDVALPFSPSVAETLPGSGESKSSKESPRKKRSRME